MKDEKDICPPRFAGGKYILCALGMYGNMFFRSNRIQGGTFQLLCLLRHNKMGGGVRYVFICRRTFICNLYLGIADLHR